MSYLIKLNIKPNTFSSDERNHSFDPFNYRNLAPDFYTFALIKFITN